MSVSRDYFAELYVAGLMADAGWNVYFPHRDRGLDFIVSKTQPDGTELIRAVQVKGKFPMKDKKNKDVYGYIGELNQRHPEMVLAIPFFCSGQLGPAVCVACVAYMPFWALRPHTRGWRCEPARFVAGVPRPRRDFVRFFDADGLSAVAQATWSAQWQGVSAAARDAAL